MSDKSSETSEGASADEPGCPGELLVTLDAEDDEPPDLPWLQRMLERVINRLDLDSAELSIVIVDDETMMEFNDRFKQRRGTTDVLAFDMADEPAEAGALRSGVEGEVYVCLPEARRQAERRGHPPDHELLLYMTHGLLHLVGYDDADPEQYQRMHEKEDELLQGLDVGPVFRRSGTDPEEESHVNGDLER